MIDSTMFYGFVKIFITYTTLKDTTGISPKYGYGCFCSQKGVEPFNPKPNQTTQVKKKD